MKPDPTQGAVSDELADWRTDRALALVAAAAIVVLATTVRGRGSRR